MAHWRLEFGMPAPTEVVFDAFHLRHWRLKWDSLVRGTRVQGGAPCPFVGAVTESDGSGMLRPLSMTTRFASFDRPNVAAAAMVGHSFPFTRWVASMQHRGDGPDPSCLIYTYRFEVGPAWIRWPLEPIVVRILIGRRGGASGGFKRTFSAIAKRSNDGRRQTPENIRGSLRPVGGDSTMKLLLLGASGLVGSQALQLALASDAISEVIAPTRKPLPPADKLVNPVCPRLDDFLPMLASYGPQAVICALGTTLANAGSKEAFRHVDHELPVAFGKAAHAAGVETFAIVSAVGASADSRFFYTRTKGEAERDLQAIGFRSLTICRPSLIGGERNETRRAEHAAMALIRVLKPVLPKRLRINPASSIAAALLRAVIESKPGARWISSDEMN